ncbi:class A beta-lactamase-related serine hydrolase [Streptomyces nitrosporeus]|uniref:Class A beta-lactamase-related serine hydrolase n=1 Tax=Streptomyces nitrosporeus TaxID=28894 RepID=A0A5J6FJP3_9ACTN|nr:serine hydrolase domain-containing protein [Streptomyces nitrosporeus]QEU75534.1 class A beta-lactamase-related serine hydrolase [Streptomyces nitrosporeus]GGZ25271.1 serine hydrolase [Streptomyces nitrosporeus]
MSAHLDAKALSRLTAEIERDIDAGSYDGVHLILARHGEIALNAVIGQAERATSRPLEHDAVFRILSLTKAFTNTLALMAIGEGRLALSTRVVDVIPEFLGTDRFRAVRKDRINLGHLLTHRSGMPATPDPGLGPDRFGVLADVIEALCSVDAVNEPGTDLNYSPSVNHALMGEMVRRVYGYDSFRQLAHDRLFAPLGMDSTRFGLPRKWAGRAVPLKVYVPEDGWLSPDDIECLNTCISEDAELPWVGAVSTAQDVFAFAEMLRRGGEHSGEQLIAPAVLDHATRLQTGDMVNDLYAGIAQTRGWETPPGNFGLGFSLSGTGTHPSFFGPFTSPRTYGNYGAGSSLFWVDPERDMTLVFLSAGVMDEGDNVARFQKISTMAVAAAL